MRHLLRMINRGSTRFHAMREAVAANAIEGVADDVEYCRSRDNHTPCRFLHLAAAEIRADQGVRELGGYGSVAGPAMHGPASGCSLPAGAACSRAGVNAVTRAHGKLAARAREPRRKR